MKLLPILLLNVVTVGAGLVIYDQVRQDETAPVFEDVVATDESILARLDALERGRSDGAPMLQAKGEDPRVLARLDELERRLGSEKPVAMEETASEDAPSGERLAGAPEMSDEGPSEEEVRRFRKLNEAARQMEREEREMRRIDEVLANLEIDLSDKQKTQLGTAYREFQSKRGEMFRKAFATARENNEDMREVMGKVRDDVNQEFASVITNFIPADDAQKISESLNTRGGMSRRMGMGGGRGR